MQIIDDRSVLLATHIIDTKDTVRKTAKLFGISKSTVHMVVVKQSGLQLGLNASTPFLVNSVCTPPEER